MKVSVIIPTYNEEDVIGECLISLFRQTLKDFEVVVVDDGSTDTTSLKLRSASKKGLIKYLRQKHLGAGAARNLGAKMARGKILVFVDADMTFDKGFLGALIEPIVKGEVRGTFSKEEFVANWDNIWARCWNINENWEAKKRHPEGYPDKQKVFRAILKADFDRVGGFDPKKGYMDDWSLGEKLGFEAQNAPGARFFHKNPEKLREVFDQAKWVAKRPYKLGKIGAIYALLRSSLPVSLVIGFYKSLAHSLPQFIIFKVAYDFGIFLGILEYLFLGKTSR